MLLTAQAPSSPESNTYWYRYKGGPFAVGALSFGTAPGFANIGDQYSVSMTRSGSPMSSFRLVPPIPWLSVSGSGVSGTPSEAGVYTFRVEGLNASGSVIATSDQLTVRVLTPVTVTLGKFMDDYKLPKAQLGKAYAAFDFKTLATVAGQDPDTGDNVTTDKLTWSLGSGSDELKGLTLSPEAGGGVLSGKPEEIGTFSFEVVGTYTDKEGRQVYTIKVGPAILNAGQLAVGFNHACVVTTEGGAMCWGAGTGGQLGDNNSADSPGPVPVSGLESNVQAVTAGNSHSCAITNSGAAWCWGSNHVGQLGNNTIVGSNVPVPVFGLGSGVTSISAGTGNSTCAVHLGVVKCWGAGDYGVRGNGTGAVSSPQPVSSSTGIPSTITTVALGTYHGCAITNAGALWCWGYNTAGQVGDGNNTGTDRHQPYQITSLASGVSAVELGHVHSCAIHNGAAMCWGSNGNGQLGDPAAGSRRSVPHPVPGLSSGVTSIASGSYHSCAVQSGAVRCWGDGATSPAPVSGLTSGVTSVGAGNNFSCAMVPGGKVKCWGDGSRGKLGDGLNTSSSTPVNVGATDEDEE